MFEYLLDNSIFYIVPENIDNAGGFSLKKNENNTMTFISAKDIKLKPKDLTEIFVNSNEGIIYFHSTVKTVENNELTIDFPYDYEILQRRENKRVKMNMPVVIKNDGEEKEVMLLDISAGGIKILAEKQLLLNTEYEVIFNFDKTSSVFTFLPQRIIVRKESNKYEISGQIMSKSPKDKIALVQYCYKKAFEQSNRK